MGRGAAGGTPTAPAGRGSVAGDAAVALAVVAVAIAVQWPLRLCSLNLADEGLVLQGADMLLHGGRLYADAVAYAWPGAFWTAALAFAAFGTSVETARTLAVVVFALATGVVYLIARWSSGRAGALGVVLAFLGYRVWAYPHWQMLNYSPLAMAWVLVATWLGGEALATRRRGFAAAAGVAGGLAALCKQDVGLACGGAVGLALLLAPVAGRWRRAVACAAGAAAVLLGAAAVLAARGTLPIVVRETILAPLHGAAQFDYPARPTLWPLAQDPALRAKAFTYLPSVVLDVCWTWLITTRAWLETGVVDVAVKLVFHLPWLLLLAALPLVVRELRAADGEVPPQRPILVLALVTAATVAAFNRPQDWVHLLVLYPPPLLLLVALGARAARAAGRAGVVVRAAGWALAVAVAGSAAWLGTGLVRLHDTPVRSARGTLWAPASQARPLQALLDDVGARPGAPLASLPYQPLVNFLAARPGASRHYIVWPVDLNAARDDEVIAGLDADPRTEVVYSQMQVPHYPRPQAYAEKLFAHLADHWRVRRVIGGDPGGFTFQVLEPRAPRPGRSLLDALAAAPVTIVPPAGPPREPSPAERARLVGTAVWPFQRVLRMATTPEGWTAVSLPLVPAAGDRFVATYGTNPDQLGIIFEPGARFAIVIAAPGEPERELFAARVEPAAVAGDRVWRRVDVDLSPWRGRPVTLELRVGALIGGPVQPDVAGWGDPRLVSAREEAERRDVPGALQDVARPELR